VSWNSYANLSVEHIGYWVFLNGKDIGGFGVWSLENVIMISMKLQKVAIEKTKKWMVYEEVIVDKAKGVCPRVQDEMFWSSKMNSHIIYEMFWNQLK